MTVKGTKSVGGRLLATASAVSLAAALAFAGGAVADDVGKDWQLGNKVVGGVAADGGRLGQIVRDVGDRIGGLLPVAFDRKTNGNHITNDWDAYEAGLITKAELLAEHPEYDKPGYFDNDVGVVMTTNAGGGRLIPVAFEAGVDGDVGMNCTAEFLASHPEFDKPGICRLE